MPNSTLPQNDIVPLNLRRERHPDSPDVTSQKILFVTAVGWSQFMFMRGQNAFMKQHGFELHSLASPNSGLEAVQERDGAFIYPVPIARRGFSIMDLVALVRMSLIMKRVRPTIAHLSTPKAAFLGAIAATLARVPIRIFLVRGLISPNASGWHRLVYYWAERLTAKLCHRTLFISKSLQDLAIADRVVDGKFDGVLANGSSNGIDVERFDPARVPLPDSAAVPEALRHAPVIGYVGRLTREKGLEELAQVWNALREEFPDAWLLLVGGWEPEDPVSPEIRQSLENDPRVVITGFVREVAPYFRLMSVFAFPSHREGFGNAPMEASAMQVPVVASDVVGCRDAVQDGVTGTLVPAKNVSAFVAAIRRYLNDPQLAKKHGQAGRERAVRDFRPEVIWQSMLEEYRKLLRSRGFAVPTVTADTAGDVPEKRAA